MDVVSFLDRYAPKTFNDFLGNRMQKQQMRDFMRTKEPACKIIIGPSGSGKTTFCTLLLKEFDVHIIRPTYDTFASHKEFMQFIETSLKTTTIMDMIQKRSKVLFLDDVDVLLSQDRYAGSYLVSLVQKIQNGDYGNAKVIITCVSSDEKRLTDLKKKVDHMKLHNPPLGDCLLHVMNVLDKEGYEVDEESLCDLIKNMQFNLRNILTNVFTCCDVEDEGNKRAYYDMNIFDIVQHVFQNAPKGLDDLEIALSSDPTLISYMMYDNFREYIKAHYQVTPTEYYQAMMKVQSFYMDSSIIEADAFLNNEWDNIEWGNLIKCGSIRAFQNSLPKKTTKTLPFRVNYTTIMTRASQHYCNMKKLERYATHNDIQPSNIALLSEVGFEKQKDKSWKFPAKDPDGAILTSYMSNICTKDGKVHGRRVRKAVVADVSSPSEKLL